MLVDGTQVGLITPAGTSTALRDGEFHGHGRNAHHPVRRHEPAGRRQHRLDRPGGAHAGGRRDQRRRFRDAGLGRDRPTRSRPAVSPWQFSGSAGVSSQWQRLHHRQRQCPRRGPGRLHQEQRQHEPDRLPRRRHVQHLVPGRPTRRYYRPRTRKSRCWSTAAQVGLDHALPSTQYRSLPDVEFHGRGRHAHRAILGMIPRAADSTAFLDDVAIAPEATRSATASFEAPALAGQDLSRSRPAARAWQFSGWPA